MIILRFSAELIETMLTTGQTISQCLVKKGLPKGATLEDARVIDENVLELVFEDNLPTSRQEALEIDPVEPICPICANNDDIPF